MAHLRLASGRSFEDPGAICDALAPIGVRVAAWPVPPEPRLRGLLGQAVLSDAEKDEVLVGFEERFRRLRDEAGYQARDLIVLHADVPGLETMLQKFDRCHTHADDEVRYIVDGEGTFGFVMPSGDQVHLTLQAGDYINVPAGTEHWFILTASRRIKAVRYFTGTDGWTPQYTKTAIRPL